MDEFYEFTLELTKSSGFVALASFIFGYLTKRCEINLTEKHRRQQFLDEERIKTYKKFFRIMLSFQSILAIVKTEPIASREAQKTLFNLLLEINTIIPEMQILAEKDLFNSLSKLSTLINSDNLPAPSKDLKDFINKPKFEKITIIANTAGEVQDAIRNEILLSKNRSFLIKFRQIITNFCRQKPAP